MEKQRNIKMLSIIALVVAIVGMSLGFAAFSATLNISSSATVTPSSSNFSIGFYPWETPTLDDAIISPGGSGGGTGSNVTLSPASTTISGLKANFTEPGQYIEYSFFVGNDGEYDAYLRAINFLNVSGKTSNKVCTPGTGTTASLVEATCNAISMQVEVNGTIATSTNTSISGNTLAKGAFTEVKVTISYAANGARADGPFTVDFGGISLDYSTVDNNVTLISFNFSGTTYQAEYGMTWQEYINSKYNHPGFAISNGRVVYAGNYVVDSSSMVYPYQTIVEGEYYSYEQCCFDPYMRVLMADGTYRQIVDVQEGDMVMSLNEDTGEYVAQKVTQTIINKHSTDLVYVNLSNGTQIAMRAYHPLLTTEGYKSLRPEYAETKIDVGEVALLEIGDTLVGYEENVTVVSIEQRPEVENYYTYNLSVEGYHNYIVEGVVVHNAGCPNDLF